MSYYDEETVARAVAKLLEALGEDLNREGIEETPSRMARAWKEFTRGMRSDPADHLDKTFAPKGATGIVLQRGIPFYSLCEHHLVPFHGMAAVAYVPNEKEPRIVGLSKLARLVLGYAARLQIQERLTFEIAEAIQNKLNPHGVAVVLKAEHLCMAMRGVRTPGSETVTSEVRGVFKIDQMARAEVMALLKV